MSSQLGSALHTRTGVRRIYLGTCLIAFSTLALEITLTRLLSVTSWYYMAFFAVSTAMLGLTAGATTVYLCPERFTPQNAGEKAALSSLAFSLIVPVSLVLLCLTPLVMMRSIMSLMSLMVTTFACSLPFYFSGIVLTVVLTRIPLPIGRLYASDLIGASLGCVFVLGGLEVIDAPSLVLLCGSGGALAALSFSSGGPSGRLLRAARWAFPVLAFLAVLNSASVYGIRPLFAKGSIRRPGIFEKWNSYSLVKVEKEVVERPQYWGMSPLAPEGKQVYQHHMDIDGEAATIVRRFSSLEDIDHLRFDVTNVAYFLRPHGGACVIGVGGGRDVQSAILFGHEKIVAIDVNPVFIGLLQGSFREFAGVADRKGVSLIVDEARSYLSIPGEQYSIIQMSMIDTWAATGAGAFTLSENSLYTEEAWMVFYSRLSDDGIFTVSRWHNPGNLGETGRVASLAVASLLREGVSEPARHIAMVTSGNISTLLLCKRPLSEPDIRTLREVCRDLKYDADVVPGVAPEDSTLRGIVSARSAQDLERAVEGNFLNIEPPTDENPFFFNMLRLRGMTSLRESQPGVVRGNRIATLTLIGLILSLLFITVVTIILPLAMRTRLERRLGRSSRISWPSAAYFSLIGAGFMCVEMGLVQRLSVFLGHPLYALGILLTTIIASAGIGSSVSEYFPVDRPWRLRGLAVVTGAAILVEQQVLRGLTSGMITSPIPARIAVSVAAIFPLGILLGFLFPIGMRLARSVAMTEMAWYWALNGVFGLLFTALTVFISIYLGISVNFFLGAASYIALVPCLGLMVRASQSLRSNEKPGESR